MKIGMNKIVRVVLTFRNPSIKELLQLSNLIWVGESLTEQKIYVASPETQLLKHSCERLENLSLIHKLEQEVIHSKK